MNESLAKLQYVMTCLRDPEFGCNWDKKQTFNTIAPYTLEEAYEVIDAIEKGDSEHLKEELGDLLFQIVFYAQMAQEEKRFTFEDVAAGITEKMLRRHPHVFPDGDINRFGEPNNLTEEQIAEQWQVIKAQEKVQREQTKKTTDASVLAEIPSSMPALMQAVKIQKEVAKYGFDWPTIAPVFAKVREELDELEEAIKEQSTTHIEEEMGDILFAVSNLSRHLAVSPDIALNKTNLKFRRRFARVESLANQHGRELKDCSLDELDRYWEQAKQEGL
ncbi:nucleoside triphosphate pyrophosphohydrolase [Marinomonas sp. C2222]|uniref:Nucleoside triphosphate pyrophosphohydrolase n=1 Tax=Marinomonas sargassi TaxID=2984494 RepID=A0ABT2YVA3_9GAMM|nr:nucleoside triphosphate pyrophosphohydrolase [Marinomonas sargassi]MCV2403832.1 nucleoside triphosphate pyrophosphohydrolase [Marinomonas sargassi]